MGHFLLFAASFFIQSSKIPEVGLEFNDDIVGQNSAATQCTGNLVKKNWGFREPSSEFVAWIFLFQAMF